MKQITAYKIHSGKLFESAVTARKYERRQEYEAVFTKAREKFWQLHIIDTSCIMEFLNDNVELITKYLELEKVT